MLRIIVTDKNTGMKCLVTAIAIAIIVNDKGERLVKIYTTDNLLDCGCCDEKLCDKYESILQTVMKNGYADLSEYHFKFVSDNCEYYDD